MPELDPKRLASFEEKMTGILNGGMLSLMTSIGRQTGLFEVLADLPHSSSAEIASAASLDERYVREWLGAMTTGGIVEYDPDGQTYALPREHAAILCNVAGPKNLARYTQYVSMMAEVEADVIGCFRNGGGVSYEKYPRFQNLMAESSALRFDHLLIGEMIPLTAMSDGLERGIDVLDIGCGKGHAINVLAVAFPRSRFVGYDISAEGIAAARSESAALRTRNARFGVHDLADLGETDRYDLITAFDVIHDQARPTAVLASVARALRAEGTFLMMDVRASSHLERNLDHPAGPFLYSISTMHCMAVSLAQSGAGLGTVWGEEKAQAMLAEAGFRSIELAYLNDDRMSTFYVARKV